MEDDATIQHERVANFDFHTGNSIIVKNVPRSTNADVWDEWADEDEDDDFLSPEMRERLKALDAETAPPVDKCPIQHDLGDEDALKCSKDWVNAIVSDAGICPFSLSADRAGLPLGDVRLLAPPKNFSASQT